jgi:hypothetical protein
MRALTFIVYHVVLMGAMCATIWGTEIMDLADVPVPFRTKNWEGEDVRWCPGCNKYHGEGSCVHASTITMLKWFNYEEHATWWRENFNSGETEPGLLKKLEASGLPYAYNTDGDPAFLDWCARNRLVVGIFYKKAHAINLVDFTSEYAVLLDNNNPERYEYVDRDTFVRRWRTEFQGFAWTFVKNPPPPLPVRP